MKVMILCGDDAPEIAGVVEDAIQSNRMICEMGHASSIYMPNPGNNDTIEQILPLHSAPRLTEEDVLFYYHTNDATTRTFMESAPCRKILILTKATPPRFWKPYSRKEYAAAETIHRTLCGMNRAVDACVTFSTGGEKLLRELNFQCPIYRRPLLYSMLEYTNPPEKKILEQYDTTACANFLYTGAFIPEHHIEDVIRIAAAYQKMLNQDVRLFITGAFDKKNRYAQRVINYTKALEMEENVIFTNGASFSQLLGYYQVASLFLDMSEHDPIGISLMEAEYFGIPILARESGIAPDILGQNGLLLSSDNAIEAALLAKEVLSNPRLRREVVSNQRDQLQALSLRAAQKQFQAQFEKFLDDVPPRIEKHSRRIRQKEGERI